MCFFQILSQRKYIWITLRNSGNSGLELHCGNVITIPYLAAIISTWYTQTATS